MALHPHSLPLLRYIKTTIHELIDPLEQVQWALWEEGDDTVDPKLSSSALPTPSPKLTVGSHYKKKPLWQSSSRFCSRRLQLNLYRTPLAFLSSNPGLRSRFNKYLNFEDYAPPQLVEIFARFCTRAGYQVSQSTRDELMKVFSVLFETRDETFGNGRLARNLFELTISNQANRIVGLTNLSVENLSTITTEDVPGLADLHTI